MTSPPTTDEVVTRFLLIRHGETSYNVQGIIQGQLDIPLNSLGRKQAALVGQALRQSEDQIDEVWSSPLQRAADTALAIVPPTSSSTSSSSSTLSVQYDDRLKERAFGSLEGHSFKGEKTDAIPGIESMEVLRKRLGSFWEDRLLAEYEAGRHSSSSSSSLNGSSSNGKSSKARTIVVVGHGASLSCLLNVVAAQGYEMAEGVRPSRLWNCSITELLVTLKPSTSTQEEQWEDVDPSKDRSPSNGSSKLGKLRDTLLPRRTSQNGSSLPTSPTSPSFALFSRSVLVTRWADTRHLEEGFTTKTTQGDQDGAAGQQEAVGVSKEANADEIEVEEEEEERKPLQS